MPDFWVYNPTKNTPFDTLAKWLLDNGVALRYIEETVGYIACCFACSDAYVPTWDDSYVRKCKDFVASCGGIENFL